MAMNSLKGGVPLKVNDRPVFMLCRNDLYERPKGQFRIDVWQLLYKDCPRRVRSICRKNGGKRKIRPNSGQNPICRVTGIALETNYFEQTKFFYLDFELFIDATPCKFFLILVTLIHLAEATRRIIKNSKPSKFLKYLFLPFHQNINYLFCFFSGSRKPHCIGYYIH